MNITMKYVMATVLLCTGTRAHMELLYPAPFRSQFNPQVTEATKDINQKNPLTPEQFPCKGYQKDMDSPTGLGKPTAEFTTGGTHNFSINQNTAVHGGGSCQLALSYDKGKSFTVIHSYLGSCGFPGKYDFTMPSDAPTSNQALLAWTWYNVIGNREFYMNCAAVSIVKGTGGTPPITFQDRPDLFVANLDNGCQTAEGKEPIFPNSGPESDVTKKFTILNNDGWLTGTCTAVKGIGGRSRTPVHEGELSSSSNSLSLVSQSKTSSGFAASVDLISSLAASKTLISGGLNSMDYFPTSDTISTKVASNNPTITRSLSSKAASTVEIYTTEQFTLTNTVFVTVSPSTIDFSVKDDPLTIQTVAGGGSSYPISSHFITKMCDNRPGTISAATNSLTMYPLMPTAAPIASIPLPGVGGITIDGTCGGAGGMTCNGSTIYGACCSQFGYCGNLDIHCGRNCDAAHGICGDAGKTANAGVLKMAKKEAKYWSA